MTQESTSTEEGGRDESFIPGPNDGSQETPTLDPALVEAIRKDIEKDVVAALVDEDTDSPIYKGMQRVVSERDRDLASARQEIAALKTSSDSSLTQLGAAGSALEDEVSFLSEKLVSALPDEEREQVQRELSDRRMQRIEAENKKLRDRLDAPPPTGPAGGYESPQGPSELETQLLGMQKDVTKDLRGMAKEFGIDPDNELLDYGDETNLQVGSIQRNKQFAASLRKAQLADSTGADDIRPNGKQPKTRASSGGSAPAVRPAGETLLATASAEHMDRMRRATPESRRTSR